MMKALVIDQPWFGTNLLGGKTRLMCKPVCRHRGSIALVCKESDQAVGIVVVTECRSALADFAAYAAAETFHGVPPSRRAKAVAVRIAVQAQ
jgi:hypothetical protein